MSDRVDRRQCKRMRVLRDLVGAVRPAQLLHSLVSAPGQLQCYMDALSLILTVAIGMQRYTGAGSIRYDSYQLLT